MIPAWVEVLERIQSGIKNKGKGEKDERDTQRRTRE